MEKWKLHSAQDDYCLKTLADGVSEIQEKTVLKAKKFSDFWVEKKATPEHIYCLTYCSRPQPRRCSDGPENEVLPFGQEEMAGRLGWQMAWSSANQGVELRGTGFTSPLSIEGNVLKIWRKILNSKRFLGKKVC